MLFRNLFACLLAAAAATAGADPNVISAVEVKDEGAAVTIEIRGSKAPNFTSFSMADPPRFVIDLSESTFDGVPEDLVVDDALVKVVKNLSYGSGPTAIARILVAFTREVDPPEVSALGSSLLVRVAKPGTAATIAAAPPAVDPAARAAAEAEAAAVARAEAAAKAEADARAKAEAEAKAKADAARAEEARLAAAAVAALAAEPAAVAAPADVRPVEAAPVAEAAAPIPEPLPEVTPAAEPVAAEPVAAVPVAAEPMAAEPMAAEPIETLAVSAPSAVVREIGFRQLPTGSRVYVRTSATPRFTVQDAGEDVIRLELENTRVTRRNDVRFLDTSFFPSAVAMVAPARQGTSYVVEIKLRERVPYQQKIEGDVLAIDFERPASAAPAAPPAAPPPGDAVEAVAPAAE